LHEAVIAHELVDLCEAHLRLRGGRHATVADLTGRAAAHVAEFVQENASVFLG
jgi:hypothetical protein